MVLVWLTIGAVQVASVFAFPTMGDRSVTYVHPATMDTQIVQVSGLDPSMFTSVAMIDKPVASLASPMLMEKNVAAGFTGLTVASSHDSMKQTSSFSHTVL